MGYSLAVLNCDYFSCINKVKANSMRKKSVSLSNMPCLMEVETAF